MTEAPGQESRGTSRWTESARRFVADHQVAMAVIAATSIGLVVALWNLGGKPLSYDETFEALLVMHPPLRFAYWVATFETTGAFYHSFLWLWKFLGTNEVALRLPSVLFAVAAVPVTFNVGRRLMSTPWAFVAALLLSLSALWLSHAQEARPYALYLLMAGLSTLALLRTLEKPGRIRWIVYALITVLAVWTHMMMAFVVLGQAVAMAFHPDVRRWWRPAATSVVLAAVAALPIAYSITHANQARWYWITDPSPGGLQYGVWHLASDMGLIALLWFVLWALGTTIGVRRWMTDRKSAWPIVLIAAISVTPIIVPWLLSFIRPMYTPRYIVPALPAMILLGTLALSTLRPRIIGIGLTCVLVGVGAINVWNWHADTRNADFRTAVRILVEEGTPADGLAYFYRGAFEPGALYEYRYYLTQTPRSDDRPTILLLEESDAPLDQRIASAIAGYQRLFFVGIPRGTDNDEGQRAIDEIERTFVLDREYEVNGLTVRLYVRPAG